MVGVFSSASLQSLASRIFPTDVTVFAVTGTLPHKAHTMACAFLEHRA